MEEQLAKLLGLIPMGVLVLDPGQNVIYANFEAKRLIHEDQPGEIHRHAVCQPAYPDCGKP
jgi:PAS domain-containing protein